jgi:Na+:H+ antiporter, NhaA family
MLGGRNVSIYFLLGGLMWLAFDSSGIHATITGVVLGLLTPARRWVNDERLYAILERVVAYPAGQQRVGSGDTRDRDTLLMAPTAAREALSPVERLEILLHPWVGFAVMPLFALANAGVPISFGDVVSPVALTVFAGFVFGKPVGRTGLQLTRSALGYCDTRL